ncbi:RNA-directed DNA polymerase, eukaryota, reverse transcriptase zinc-binding domain protein [Tanacetum coccineum]
MDSVIEDASTKWNMTVIGHFVGYRMSYREIMGNLRRMWRSCQFVDIIMNNSGLYFSKFKSHDGMQAVIENGPCSWEVDSTKGLVDSVEKYGIEVWANQWMLDVEYTWRPPVCEHCKFFGHTLKNCNAKDLTKEETAMKESMKPMKVADVKVDNNEGWKNVGYRRNVYRRGGFSNNGRGSFGSGRGNYMNTGETI